MSRLLLFLILIIELFQFFDRFPRVQSFRTSQRAHAELEALIEFHIATKSLKTFLLVLISAIDDPTESLLEN